MLVKINANNTIEKFPYSEREFRLDFSNISFPKELSTNLLNEYGVHRVVLAEKPVFDLTTHRVVRNQSPTFNSGVWTIDWTLIALDVDESTRALNGFKRKVTEEADRRVSLVSGDSTDKLLAMMTAIDLLDIKNSRDWTASETATMNHLRNVKVAVRAIRVAESVIKTKMEAMTGAQLEALDIPNHPDWS